MTIPDLRAPGHAVDAALAGVRQSGPTTMTFMIPIPLTKSEMVAPIDSGARLTA
jgi:hypothetical protein